MLKTFYGSFFLLAFIFILSVFLVFFIFGPTFSFLNFFPHGLRKLFAKISWKKNLFFSVISSSKSIFWECWWFLQRKFSEILSIFDRQFFFFRFCSKLSLELKQPRGPVYIWYYIYWGWYRAALKITYSTLSYGCYL